MTSTNTVRFDASENDRAIAMDIAKRAVALAGEDGVEVDQLSTFMDIVATHQNGCPLDLERLAAADDFNLAHDVFGIARHINRETGEIEGGFLPRFAAKVADEVAA